MAGRRGKKFPKSSEVSKKRHLHTRVVPTSLVKCQPCSSVTSATNDTSPCPTWCSSSLTSAASRGRRGRARVRVGSPRPAAGRVQGRHSEAGLRREVQSRDAPGRRAAPVPPARGRPARLRLAEVGAVAARSPSSASTRSSRTSWNCGATAGNRSSSARSAGTTSTARGPRCRSRPTATTRKPASSGTRSATRTRSTRSTSRRRSAAGCTTFTPDRERAGSSRFPGSSRPRSRRATIAVLASNITWNAYNNFGGRSNYIHADGLPPTPTVNSRPELKRYTDAGFVTWGADVVRAAVVRPAGAVQPHRLRTRRSPTRSRAGRPATSRRPSGGCSAGSNARLRLRLLRRDAAPRRHARPARSTACWSSQSIPSTGRGGCTTA